MTTAPHMPTKAHSAEDVHPRPKGRSFLHALGILKNTKSYTTAPPAGAANESIPVPTIAEPSDTKELTLQNTLQNAGRRRSSSTTRPGSGSRRQSVQSAQDENEPRLKWDEANLYLAEQDRTAKMKIDEPKTPYAPHYDPAEDDEEMRLEEAKESLIDAQEIVVDELDNPSKSTNHPKKGVSEDDIPGLELGEADSYHGPADATSDPRIYRDRSLSMDSHKSDKHVVVGDEVNGDGLVTSDEAKEKHRQFEEHRKKHYEMRNIKELLAHPEELDEMEEDDEEAGPPPPMPQIPDRFRNAQ
ncbi:hypothetical protein N7532_006605 [Penicillium argentinense]|uniref:Glc8 protein n=1 Tax=Penicillium argentinense TaxID=1131581 RepID=A0A9W9FGB8_9EURO|nr:uncharacterized protein N7532_006605 [Penicillium argentinense]KAJ5099604.1 hypothetical protein N7532_006605 [Penicillium argentinense]